MLQYVHGARVCPEIVRKAIFAVLVDLLRQGRPAFSLKARRHVENTSVSAYDAGQFCVFLLGIHLQRVATVLVPAETIIRLPVLCLVVDRKSTRLNSSH